MVGAGGASVIDATGAGVTVIDAVPEALPLVAVTVAVPGATPVTTPVCETVATAGVSELQTTVRPVSTLPFRSFVTAVNVVVPPALTLLVGGETVTLATGTTLTVTVTVAALPSLVAVMTEVPGASPVTTPADDTLAMVGVAELHVTMRPVRTLPLASWTVGVSVTLPVTKMFGAGGARVIDATGAGVTVTEAVPATLPLVAVIVAVPAETVLTTPVAETVATADALDVHVTTRPVSTLPLASSVTAVNVAVPPTIKLVVGGETVMLATGTAVTVTVTVAVLPSQVPVMTEVPGASPVTTPAADTLATAGVPELHATTRPVRTLPSASLTVGISVTLPPTKRFGARGDNVMLETGAADTEIVAVPDFPSLVATTFAVPTATPVTTPDAETVAAAGLSELHDTTRPPRLVPPASLSVATSATVFPTTTLGAAGDTTTLATGAGVTATVAVPDTPSHVAVIVTLAGVTPVTSPFGETVATDGLLDVHVTTRPVTIAPATS